MIGLFDFILLESTFGSKDFTKHDYLYTKGLLQKLVDGGDVRLGKKGEDGSIKLNELTPEEQETAKQMLAELNNGDYKNITKERFNDIFKSVKLKLSNFFKGDYTGYVAGLASKNKGNEFEEEFLKNYAEKYEAEVKKIVDYDELTDVPSADGSLNQKRPIKKQGKGFILDPCTPGNYEIGNKVTDITIHTDKGPIYLSLKYGNTVTFGNPGIKSYLNSEFFDHDKMSPDCKQFLDFFAVDPDRIKDIFNNYVGVKKGTKVVKDEVDVTKEYRTPQMMSFIKSMIGCGFILVHKLENGHVHFIDLTDEQHLNKLIGSVKKATIYYPLGGATKRVDIVVELAHVELKFNIRSKDGGTYPTHIMCDYKFI